MNVDTICFISCSESCSDKVCFDLWDVKDKCCKGSKQIYENDQTSEVLKLQELRGFQKSKPLLAEHHTETKKFTYLYLAWSKY